MDRIIVSLTFIIAIERTTEIRDNNVADTIEINVSSTTRFSMLFLLSIFPTRIAANPNSIVNTSEKTVVSIPASSTSIADSKPKTIIAASPIGINMKHIKSQGENLLVLAFLKTCSCSIKTEKTRTFLFPNNITKIMAIAIVDQIHLEPIHKLRKGVK
jgi:hypothetical protein